MSVICGLPIRHAESFETSQLTRVYLDVQFVDQPANVSTGHTTFVRNVAGGLAGYSAAGLFLHDKFF
jgi:hypothetical protein